MPLINILRGVLCTIVCLVALECATVDAMSPKIIRASWSYEPGPQETTKQVAATTIVTCPKGFYKTSMGKCIKIKNCQSYKRRRYCNRKGKVCKSILGRFMCVKPKTSSCTYRRGKKRVHHGATLKTKNGCKVCICRYGRFKCMKKACDSCVYGSRKKRVPNGTVVNKKDGCNTCKCIKGRFMCTKMACSKPIGPVGNCGTYPNKTYILSGTYFKKGCKLCYCGKGNIKTHCSYKECPKCPKNQPVVGSQCKDSKLSCKFKVPIGDCNCDGKDEYGFITAICKNERWVIIPIPVCLPCSGSTQSITIHTDSPVITPLPTNIITKPCKVSDGSSIPDGSTMPSTDGCNTCTCKYGVLKCTKIACPEAECPTKLPRVNTFCPINTQSCDYKITDGDCNCDGQLEYRNITALCTNNKWNVPPISVCAPCPIVPTVHTDPIIKPTPTPIECPDRAPGRFNYCPTNEQACWYNITLGDCDCDGKQDEPVTYGVFCSENMWRMRTIHPCRPCEKPCILENGTSIPSGNVVPNADGCNSCRCQNGDLACTKMMCSVPSASVDLTTSSSTTVSCTKEDGTIVIDGDSVPSTDGCNTCTCANGHLRCTSRLCGKSLECPTRIPALYSSCLRNDKVCNYEVNVGDCDCDGKEDYANITATCHDNKWILPLFDECRPCNTELPIISFTPLTTSSPITGTIKSCTLSNGTSVPDGITVLEADGCNSCKCINGLLACTKMACPESGICPIKEPIANTFCSNNNMECEYEHTFGDCNCDGEPDIGTLTSYCDQNIWVVPVVDECMPCPINPVPSAGYCTASDGTLVPEGESVPSEDGCNSCFCTNGVMACTRKGCQSLQVCPIEQPISNTSCLTNDFKCNYEVDIGDCDCDGKTDTASLTSVCVDYKWSVPVPECKPCSIEPTLYSF